MMTEVDAQLGRLFDGLRERGAWDDTLVVLTSDHGEQLGDHWLTEKLGWFDQSYHVPLIVRDPRRESDATRGAVVDDRFTENVDVMPTILEWLGVRRAGAVRRRVAARRAARRRRRRDGATRCTGSGTSATRSVG